MNKHRGRLAGRGEVYRRGQRGSPGSGAVFAPEPMVLNGNRRDAGSFTFSIVFAMQFLIDAEKHLLSESTASDVETPDPFEDSFLGFGQSRAL